jgi:ferredoxin
VAQVFHRGLNTAARASIGVGIIAMLVGGGALAHLYRSSFVTRVGHARPQPVPFSHLRHVAGNGLDCRYCHTTVEDGPFAGIPPTETCMACHSQIFNDSPMFAPVHESWQTQLPLEWVRVHDLPDFAYFDHSIHVNRGIGCSTCHGRVDLMPLTEKTETLHMQWCLECHRAPEKYVRPRDKVYDMEYDPAEMPLEQRQALVEEYGIATGQLTNCSICHR